jgi:hypothetical protein
MGMIEDLQAENEAKYGKKNFSAPYDPSKIVVQPINPTPQDQMNAMQKNSLKEQ